MNDIKVKDTKTKIKREVGKLFFKTIDDIDRFKKMEMKKIRPIKNTWYDWLINYIPEPTRKSVSALKDKVTSQLRLNKLEDDKN